MSFFDWFRSKAEIDAERAAMLKEINENILIEMQVKLMLEYPDYNPLKPKKEDSP